MKKTILLLLVILFGVSTLATAGDVHVKGYYRNDGTYVRPHVRSSPDQYKWNNYGPSKNTNQLMNPKQRDSDNDGWANYLDTDDDNDGTHDDNDTSQYGK